MAKALHLDLAFGHLLWLGLDSSFSRTEAVSGGQVDDFMNNDIEYRQWIFLNPLILAMVVCEVCLEKPLVLDLHLDVVFDLECWPEHDTYYLHKRAVISRLALLQSHHERAECCWYCLRF